MGQEIEVRPGIVSKDSEGRVQCRPLLSKIVSLYAEQNDLAFAVPGGLIGVGTKIDPTLCRADRLVGQVLGEVGALPEIYTEIQINYFLLRRLVGVRTEGDKKGAKVAKLTRNEMLMVNIGSLSTGGRVLAIKDDSAKIQLTNPVCTEVSEKIALSRRVFEIKREYIVERRKEENHQCLSMNRYLFPGKKRRISTEMDFLLDQTRFSLNFNF